MTDKPSTGRPSSYKPEYAEQARLQCEEGATDQELADFFEVSARTLYRWKNTYPEFCQSLKASKAPADERVERSLFERATGYERDEVDVRVVGGEIVQTTIRKFYPPDTTAAIFWLKNRRPEAWRDKTEVDATVKGEVEHTHSVSDATRGLLEGLSSIGANRQPAPPVPN